jgi:hypothetical protein
MTDFLKGASWGAWFILAGIVAAGLWAFVHQGHYTLQASGGILGSAMTWAFTVSPVSWLVWASCAGPLAAAGPPKQSGRRHC